MQTPPQPNKDVDTWAWMPMPSSGYDASGFQLSPPRLAEAAVAEIGGSIARPVAEPDRSDPEDLRARGGRGMDERAGRTPCGALRLAMSTCK